MAEKIEQAIPDFELLAKVGEGSYGTVYLAKSVTGQYRAVKVVYAHRVGSTTAFEREFRGAQFYEAVSRRHDGLIDILYVGRDDQRGFFYYVMDAADDERPDQPIDPATYRPRTLSTELGRRTALPIQECIAIGLELAAALVFLQENGLVHRDVKPSNIVFVRGKLKLADIGLVADVRDAKSVVGTKGYEPPEHHGSYAGDVYSLGKLLYEISSGRDRCEFGRAPSEEADTDDPRYARFNEIVRKACAKQVQDRYQSAMTLHKALLELRGRDSATSTSESQKSPSSVRSAMRMGAFVLITSFFIAGIISFKGRTQRSVDQIDNRGGLIAQPEVPSAPKIVSTERLPAAMEPSTVVTIPDQQATGADEAEASAHVPPSVNTPDIEGAQPRDAHAPSTADRKTTPVPGAEVVSMVQQASAIRDSDVTSAGILQRVFAQFPERGLDAAISTPKAIRPVGDDKIEIGLSVRYSLREEFVTAVRDAVSRVAQRKEVLPNMAALSPDIAHPEQVNRTGLAIAKNGVVEFFHLRADQYWTAVTAMLTGSDWMLEVPYIVYEFAPSDSHTSVFNATMPRLVVECLDSNSQVVGMFEFEVYGDCVFRREGRGQTGRDYSSSNEHRQMEYGEGVVGFTVFATGASQKRTLDLAGSGLQELGVMVVPPVGHSPAVNTYSNGKYAIMLSPGVSRDREYRAVLTQEQLRSLRAVRGRIVSPLKQVSATPAS